jgi:hypothetical protein
MASLETDVARSVTVEIERADGLHSRERAPDAPDYLTIA